MWRWNPSARLTAMVPLGNIRWIATSSIPAVRSMETAVGPAINSSLLQVLHQKESIEGGESLSALEAEQQREAESLALREQVTQALRSSDTESEIVLAGRDLREIKKLDDIVIGTADKRLERMDLSGVRHGNLEATEVSFARTLFAGSIFTRCTFTECDFDACVFSHARFHHCVFVNCSFRFAMMQGVHCGESCDFQKCNFDLCDLTTLVIGDPATGEDGKLLRGTRFVQSVNWATCRKSDWRRFDPKK